MNLFIDDLRQPFSGYEENVFRNYNRATKFLLEKGQEVDSMSIDYDLGRDETGLDILMFMQKHNIKPRHINVHSTHPQGVKDMEAYLNEHFQEVSVTFNSFD